jgi:hypothetical protein
MKKFKKLAAILAASLAVNAAVATSVFSASAEGDVIGTATLKGQMGTYAYWGVGNSGNSEDLTSTPAEITSEGGQYTASWNITGDGTASVQFLILEFESNSENYITKDTYPDLEIVVDSVKVDGEEVSGLDAADAFDYKYYANDTGTTRLYLTDEWNIHADAGLSADTVVTQSIEVTFTVNNLYASKNYGDANGDGAVDTDDAYLVLSEYAAQAVGSGSILDDAQIELCDVDGNGTLNTDDAYLILLRYAEQAVGGTVTPFPVEG